MRHINKTLVVLMILCLSCEGWAAPSGPPVKPKRSAQYAQLQSELSRPEDEPALALIPKLDISARITVIFGVFQNIESQLGALGWQKCNKMIAKGLARNLMGFTMFDRERVCFNSPVENSFAWVYEFIQADLETQSLFFASVERLRRNLQAMVSENKGG